MNAVLGPFPILSFSSMFVAFISMALALNVQATSTIGSSSAPIDVVEGTAVVLVRGVMHGWWVRNFFRIRAPQAP